VSFSHSPGTRNSIRRYLKSRARLAIFCAWVSDGPLRLPIDDDDVAATDGDADAVDGSARLTFERDPLPPLPLLPDKRRNSFRRR